MGALLNNASGVNYSALEADRAVQSRAALRQKLKAVSENDLGKSGSLRRRVLALVVAEDYDRGKDSLQQYVESKSKIYPVMLSRVDKFVKHACDLIQAIQTKRSFPGLGSLSLSKQQEITEKVLIHFQELKHAIKTIERTEKDILLSDVRSTAWPVTVLGHAVVALAAVAFALTLVDGMWHSFFVVFDALCTDVVERVTQIMGW